MSGLQVFDTLEQGSDEWLQARAGILTASVIGNLITPTLKVADNDTSRGVTETLVAERITGLVDRIHPSADMQRGTLDEPFARNLYAEHYNPVTEIGFAIRTLGGMRVGASPDGLVGNNGGIEIKSRRPKIQLRTILTNTVPAENMAQIQACLFVFERNWWDYVSYCGSLALHVIRVYPDRKWQETISDTVEKFENDAAQMIDAYHAATIGAPIAPLIDHFAEMEF